MSIGAPNCTPKHIIKNGRGRNAEDGVIKNGRGRNAEDGVVVAGARRVADEQPEAQAPETEEVPEVQEDEAFAVAAE